MDLDDQAIGAGGQRGLGERRGQARDAAGVAGVGDHGQVRAFLWDRDRGDVERVARGRLEGADALLAQDHVGVASAQDVLGREQELLDRRHHAALQEHRTAPSSRRKSCMLRAPIWAAPTWTVERSRLEVATDELA